jgi:mRNA-degrading endonuclease YafQ of YafQ-DinJ toxin-antitoxin module
MKKLKLSGQFKKDLKRYKHNSEKLGALEGVLRILRSGV